MVSGYLMGKRESSLELAKGGGTLIFELGVEQIAAADGGDVEACVGDLCQSFVFLFLSRSFAVFLEVLWMCEGGLEWI